MARLNLLLVTLFFSTLSKASISNVNVFEKFQLESMLTRYSKIILTDEVSFAGSGNSATTTQFYDYVCQSQPANIYQSHTLPLGSPKEIRRRFKQRITHLDSYLRSQRTTQDLSELSRDDIIDSYKRLNDFEEKLELWRQALALVIADTKKYLLDQGQGIDKLARLNSITLNEDYHSTPNRIFRLGVSIGKRIHVGGEVLLILSDFEAIYFFIAHEVGHFVSSYLPEYVASTQQCIAQKYDGLKIFGFNNSERNELLSLGFDEEDVLDAETEDRGIDVSSEEIWADHFAHQLYSRRLRRLETNNLDRAHRLSSVLRFFCGNRGTKAGHPSGTDRIGMLTQHPYLGHLVSASLGITSSASDSYCH